MARSIGSVSQRVSGVRTNSARGSLHRLPKEDDEPGLLRQHLSARAGASG